MQSLLLALEANEKRFCSRLGAGAPFTAEVGLVTADGAANLDLAGMAELMLQVQGGCVAQIHAHQAVLEASAASLASCAVARDAANTSALEVAAAQDKALHSACRDSEHQALVEQGAKYKELSASWANLSAPSQWIWRPRIPGSRGWSASASCKPGSRLAPTKSKASYKPGLEALV